MRREVFNRGYTFLIEANPSVNVDRAMESQETYWMDLKDIPDARFGVGVDWCRHHLKFFPAISELGAACYNGDQNWHEKIVEQKRALYERKQKQLSPPMSEEERRGNQGRLTNLAKDLGRAKAVEPIKKEAPEESPTIKKSKEQLKQEQERRDFLKKQGEMLH